MTTTRDHSCDLLQQIADALWEAEATGDAVAPPSCLLTDMSLQDAYDIQRINIDRRLSRGERVVGRKIGLTSLAIQKQLGVDQPDFGIVTDRMVIVDGGQLRADTLIAARAEAEFAFRIGRDLPVSPTAHELRDAIDGVAVAIEIIDSRVADWKITLVDTVADNASSARIVYGDFVPASRELLDALPETVITMTEDGNEVAVGPGSAVLGDPILSLRWLAAAIGDFGDRLSAGDIVIAGAVAAAVPLSPGARFQAIAQGLPAVSVTVSAENEEGAR